MEQLCHMDEWALSMWCGTVSFETFWQDLKQVTYGYHNHNVYIVSAKTSGEAVIYAPTERYYSTILATFQGYEMS